VAFYLTPAFLGSPSGDNFPVQVGPAQLDQIASFLRAVNAAENVRQVRKRVTFVRNKRSTGNTSILDQAIADVGDAIEALVSKNLYPAAQVHLRTVELTLPNGRANEDTARPPFMDHALTFLELARRSRSPPTPAPGSDRFAPEVGSSPASHERPRRSAPSGLKDSHTRTGCVRERWGRMNFASLPAARSGCRRAADGPTIAAIARSPCQKA
jgi:hypothetical protein